MLTIIFQCHIEASHTLTIVNGRALGPEIVDSSGRVIWFSAVTNGQVAADFRVQFYRGKPVLTWAQRSNFGKLAGATSVNYILDDTYHIIATVRAGNRRNADAHDFLLTPQGTGLITIYDMVTADLSSVETTASLYCYPDTHISGRITWIPRFSVPNGLFASW
jgi:hypothetical protein